MVLSPSYYEEFHRLHKLLHFPHCGIHSTAILLFLMGSTGDFVRGSKDSIEEKNENLWFFYLSYKPFLSPIFCLPSLISSQAVLYLSIIRKYFKRQWSNIYTPLEEGLFQFYALEWSGEWKHLSEVCPVHQSCTGFPPDGETDNCSWFRF